MKTYVLVINQNVSIATYKKIPNNNVSENEDNVVNTEYPTLTYLSVFLTKIHYLSRTPPNPPQKKDLKKKKFPLNKRKKKERELMEKEVKITGTIKLTRASSKFMKHIN